ncbi:MAG TPA: hypothetical protein VIY27_13785 [Myxococcota bacterium]
MARDDDDEHDDEDLERFLAVYTDGTSEELLATDVDDAWDWAHAYRDGRTVDSVTLIEDD